MNKQRHCFILLSYKYYEHCQVKTIELFLLIQIICGFYHVVTFLF